MYWEYEPKDLAPLCAAFYVGEYAVSRNAASNIMHFEFKNLTKNLSEFFFEYGIYAIGRELRHTFRHVHDWSNCTYNSESPIYCSWETRRYGACECEDCSHECLNGSSINKDYLNIRSYEPSNFESFIRGLERNHNAYSNPYKFLKESIKTFRELTWDDSYGGDKWAEIAETIYKYKNVPTNTFIDCCWHLQHNTATWFNKLDYSAGREYAKLAEVLDVKFAGLDRKTIALSRRFYGSEIDKIRYIF